MSRDEYIQYKNEVYKKEKDPLDGCATWMIVPLLPFVLLGFFLEMLSNWQEYTFINKIIAGIYYYIIYIPFAFIFSPTEFIYEAGLTPFNNLNIILTIICVLFFICLFILFILFITKLRSSKYPKLNGSFILIMLYTVPFIVWIISLIIKWLFT